MLEKLQKAIREGQSVAELLKELQSKGEMEKIHTLQMALQEAVYRGRQQAVKDLITAGADLDQIAHCGDTALSIAIDSTSLPMVRLLLNLGANPDNTAFYTEKYNNVMGEYRQTPLMAAARAGQELIVLELLGSGADIYLVSDTGKTVMDYAAKSPNIIAMLREAMIVEGRLRRLQRIASKK